ncbi:hypothetical protein QYF36_015759 [Acer negundo]|nr:hypothetical protein QYF36_015759 [Acer negundo]
MSGKGEEFVYRISTAQEWENLQKDGSTFGGQLDKSTGCFHLSNLDQVQSTLQNFFLNTKLDLFLLQIDVKKLGDGLIYELVDGTNSFPHFYGPSKSFAPLPLEAVTKAEKLTLSDVWLCVHLMISFIIKLNACAIQGNWKDPKECVAICSAEDRFLGLHNNYSRISLIMPKARLKVIEKKLCDYYLFE